MRGAETRSESEQAALFEEQGSFAIDREDNDEDLAGSSHRC
jgi:hypothetical protein